MNCQDAQRGMVVNAHGDSPLSAEMSAHLAGCPACRQELEALRAFVRALPQGDLPPNAFFARQRAAIMERIETPAAPRFFPARWPWATGMAAVLLLGVYFSWSQRPRPAPAELVRNLEMIQNMDMLEAWADMESHDRA